MDSLRTGDRALIRELNTSIVLDCVRYRGPVARSEIARITGMGRSTVSGIISFLLEKGLVYSTGEGTSTGGRKPEMLAFNPRCYSTVGLKLQPGSVVGCLADLNGEILDRVSMPIDRRNEAGVLDTLDGAFRRVVSGIDPKSVLGVGVALPGLVDAVHGISVQPHFFDWRDLPIRDLLEERWSAPVWVDNDARVGSLGEKWSTQSTDASFLFVTVGVGIGASLILGGRIVDGDLVGAGHLGHSLAEPDGSPCHCGLRGCLETVASDAALVRYMREGMERRGTRGDGVADGTDLFEITPGHVFAAAKAGNEAALEAIDRVSSYLGVAIANVVKLVGIRRVIVGGETGVMGGSLLIDHLAEKVRDQVFPAIRDEIEIRPSKLHNDVWLVGAASLVLDAVFRPPIYSDRSPVSGKVVSSG